MWCGDIQELQFCDGLLGSFGSENHGHAEVSEIENKGGGQSAAGPHQGVRFLSLPCLLLQQLQKQRCKRKNDIALGNADSLIDKEEQFRKLQCLGLDFCTNIEKWDNVRARELSSRNHMIRRLDGLSRPASRRTNENCGKQSNS